MINNIRKIIWWLLGPRGLFIYGRQPLPDTPGMGDSRFVFICGLHRSGTSVVHRSLGRYSPQVSTFVNTGVPEDEAQHLQNVLPSGRQLGGPGRFAFHPNAHLTESHQLAQEQVRETLLRQWGPYLDFTQKFLLEKSPPNILRTRLFQTLFPGSIFIFLVRHPVPVALATQRRWKVGGITQALDHWFHAHKIMLSDLSHLENYAIVRYEDIIAAPATVLGKIFTFLGLPEPGDYKETFFDANAGYFEKWTELIERSPALLSSFNEETRNILEVFGYTISAPYSKTVSTHKKLIWI